MFGKFWTELGWLGSLPIIFRLLPKIFGFVFTSKSLVENEKQSYFFAPLWLMTALLQTLLGVWDLW